MVISRAQEGVVTDDFGVDFAASDMSDREAVRAAFLDALRGKNRSCWVLGDLYAYGGDDLLDALDPGMCSLKTMQNYASVCKAFPKQWRRVPLSMSHYAAASALVAASRATDALRVLEAAYHSGQTREWVRDEVKRLFGEEDTSADVLLTYDRARGVFVASFAPDWLPDGYARTIHVHRQ